ncbi:MAG TPA: TonB-dependent receptor plug domain-containing protein [Rhizomicrobium sp.]|nr:TonB-dependent receptor plug domain-containing protein [Rhizomicrobium sp.]
MKWGLILIAALWAAPACAQDVESVTVTGDVVHLLESGASQVAFGLDKPLLQTPRSVTLVSDTTLARYGVTGVDDLTAITPSAYTASYYGVDGAVSLRGTLAENYFRGFKRAENRGTYSTPLSDAAGIEILRGPPSPIYGAGKVGGLVNFLPKTAGASDALGGEVTLSYGSYSKRNASAQLSAPLDLGEAAGGVHAYGEIDDSFSFYRGLHPSHQLLEVSGTLDWRDWSFAADYMFYHAGGQVQTPGWNRLTQDLIDTGTYITGRDTSVNASNGKYLTFNDLGGNPYTFDPAFRPLACMGCSDAAHRLDTGLGTTHLDPRTVYIARGVDFSDTATHTGFVEAAIAPGEGQMLRLQLFVDTLVNDRFVSYGFPGSYRTQIGEARLRYDIKRDIGAVKTQTVAGLSYRTVHAVGKESFNSGVIALDRRDISVGPAANDIIDSPFNTEPPGSIGLGWENDVHTNTHDAGAFVTTDAVWNNFDATLGGRYDAYNVRSIDGGVLAYEPPSGRGNAGRFTYSASLSYTMPGGLVPYVTSAKSSAIEIGQAAQVATSLLADRGWLSNSFLNEAGVKFTALDDHLQGALDWYVQNRTRLEQGGGVTAVVGTVTRGAELELRYVASRNLSLTFAGSLQHSTIKGPDHSFAYIPARDFGIAPVNGFGGGYMVYDFSTLPGKGGNYEDTLQPHAVISPYVTFTGDPRNWGSFGTSFGATYVGHTSQTVPDPITFPSYVTLNASAFVQWDAWEADLNVNNLGDERYFTPDADTYAGLGALPGMGRTWKVSLKRLF